MSKLETLRQHTLYKDLPSEKDAQFLMRRLSVFNWGTFSKIHTLRFADDGSLLLGASYHAGWGATWPVRDGVAGEPVIGIASSQGWRT